MGQRLVGFALNAAMPIVGCLGIGFLVQGRRGAGWTLLVIGWILLASTAAVLLIPGQPLSVAQSSFHYLFLYGATWIVSSIVAAFPAPRAEAEA